MSTTLYHNYKKTLPIVNHLVKAAKKPEDSVMYMDQPISGYAVNKKPFITVMNKAGK